MTIYLTSSIARNIAEAVWGRGDTTAQRTNRRGTYFLNCKNDAGFILDDAALSDRDRTISGTGQFLPDTPPPIWQGSSPGRMEQ